MKKYHQTIGRRKAMKRTGKIPLSKAIVDAAVMAQAPPGYKRQTSKPTKDGDLFDPDDRTR